MSAIIYRPTRSPQVASEYQAMFDSCRPGLLTAGAPKRDVIHDIDAALKTILRGRVAYESVSVETNFPWWFVGIIHFMESGCDFNTHLHNGDSLSDRTVNVPVGRPATGKPPFLWQDSAVDALKYSKWHGVYSKDWSLAAALWRWETWNGLGYRRKGIRTPYLWGASDQEQPGRYVQDGVWSPTAWSKQVGAATILKTMIAQGIVHIAASGV